VASTEISVVWWNPLAFLNIFLESMADAGVKHGLPRDLAYKLAAQTMIGAGNMVLRTGLHPAILKDDVCSPGNWCWSFIMSFFSD